MILKGDDIRRWLGNSHTALVIAFLVLPLIVLIPMSLTSGDTLTFPTPGWSLRWFKEVIHDERLTIGELSRLTTDSFGEGAEHYASVDALVASLGESLEPHTTVLVKGSRSMGMERVVAALTSG